MESPTATVGKGVELDLETKNNVTPAPSRIMNTKSKVEVGEVLQLKQRLQSRLAGVLLYPPEYGVWRRNSVYWQRRILR